MKEKGTLKHQQAVLKALSGKIDDFYLAGGTALSLFYFQHRVSFDLDFFSPHFSPLRVRRIVDFIQETLKAKAELKGQSLKEETAKIMVYDIYLTGNEVLKVDFVEDVVKLIKKPRLVEGINVLSLEDIYIRKIYSLVGAVRTFDKIGRAKLIGGRSSAKDFYDIYFLSHTFMPLSKFTVKYCDAAVPEGLIRWFRTFDRMEMMDGVLELIADKRMDYKDMEKHFKKEIDKIAEQKLDEI